MADVPAPLDPEILLAQSDWLRRLARGLASPDAADDLVQETWRIALERPPAAIRDVASLRGWIATVVRNLARRRRRDEALRAWNEPIASRTELAPAADLVHDRLVLQRQLAQAVLELEAPYRSAIVLRYFDGLSAREVARRQEISHDAARQRVSRGLAKLRAKLDRDVDGGRTAWAAICVALARERQPGILGPLTGGALVSSKPILIASAVLALCASLVVWRVARDAGPRATATEIEAVRPGPSAIADASELESASHAAEVRAVAPVDSAPTSEPRVIDRDRDLHGIVLDPAGLPVAGAQVEVFDVWESGYSLLDEDRFYERKRVAATVTDSAGAFAIPLTPGRPFELKVAAALYPPETLAGRNAGERVVVQLHEGSTLEGRVLRDEDDAPIAGARIRLLQMSYGPGASPRMPLGETRSDSTGRFRLAGLPPRSILLEVVSDRGEGSSWVDVELEAGATIRRDVRLTGGRTVRGRVTEASSGAPIAGAEIAENWTFEGHSVTSDALGEFVFDGFSLFELHARAPGYGKAERVVREFDSEVYPEQIDFALSRGRSARGRVVDRDGNAIAGAYVAAAAANSGPEQIDWRAAISGESGEFEIADLRPDLAHELFAKKDGFGTRAIAFPAEERELERVELGDVVLQPGAMLRGTLVDETDTAIADHVVKLGISREKGVAPRADLDSYVRHREARTDDLGRFAFSDLAPGEYRVAASVGGNASPVGLDLEVAAAETLSDVKLVLPSGLSISGRVLDPDGDFVPSVVITADLETSSNSRPVSQGSTLTNRDGTFTIRGLEEGTYSLTVWAFSASNEAGRSDPPLADVRKSGVAPGTRDLEIRLPRAAPIAGKLLDAEGRAVSELRVQAVSAVDGIDAWDETDEQGRFDLRVPEGSVVDIVAWPWAANERGERRRGVLDPVLSHQARVANVLAGTQGVVLRFPPR